MPANWLCRLCSAAARCNARPMDMESVEAECKPLKRIENGQVVILRGGEKYNLFGIKLH